MSAEKPQSKAQSWAYAEEFALESEPALQARAHANEHGVRAVSPATGAVLRSLAAAVAQHAVVEIGTGAGVSGSWILQGMATEAVLTTIDVEVELQRLAREAFAAAGVASTRTRTIAGRALDVLPRLADHAYDLVLVDGDPAEAAEGAEHAVRLLRPGGVLVIPDALWFDRVADPARRDEATVAMRELGRGLREDERLHTALVPTGDGVLVATKR